MFIEFGIKNEKNGNLYPNTLMSEVRRKLMSNKSQKRKTRSNPYETVQRTFPHTTDFHVLNGDR